MRKMASIQEISEIKEHTNANNLELAIVKGWQVVVKKGDFKAGDLIVYFEIDSWIPHSLAPFLSKGKEPHVYNGISGERLRTIKLRNELSQGLILPVPENLVNREIGEDVTEELGITKWEAPIPTELSGQVDGLFPSFLRKTDQLRCQNCFDDMKALDFCQYGGVNWEVTEKLDGSSVTIFVHFKKDVAEGYYEIGICSRNYQLKINEENASNSFIRAAKAGGYFDNLHKLGKSIAIQGELCGPGIQGNIYNLPEIEIFVFDVYLIDECRYATLEERSDILGQLCSLGINVSVVPTISKSSKIPDTLGHCLEMADGRSFLNPKTKREGIVFKSLSVIERQVPSFKSISNDFLLSEK